MAGSGVHTKSFARRVAWLVVVAGGLAIGALLGTSGPAEAACLDTAADSYGYACTELPNAFVDISGVGVQVTGLSDDSTSALISLTSYGSNSYPTFQYYGKSYDKIRISSNGFIAFGSLTTSGCCAGQNLPSATIPNKVVAGYWADLNPAEGGTIHYHVRTSPAPHFVVQFKDMPHCCAAPLEVTFQIKLWYNTNRVEVAFGPTMNDGSNAVTGIENHDGTVGRRYNFGLYEVPGDGVRNPGDGAYVNFDAVPGDITEALDVRLAAPTGAAAGQQLQSTHADYAYRMSTSATVQVCDLDTNTNAVAENTEPLVLHFAASCTGSALAGDLRLAATANGAGGTWITSAHTTDTSTALLGVSSSRLKFADVNSNAVYDLGDYVYVKISSPNSTTLAGGDLRLVPVGAKGAFTRVLAGDADQVTWTLTNFAGSPSLTGSNLVGVFDAQKITARFEPPAAYAPSPPLSLTAARGGPGEIVLTWLAPSDNGLSAVSSYKVYRGTSAGGLSFLTSVSASTLTYTDTGLPGGATRFYGVHAVNGVGEGAGSNTASATAAVLPSAPQGLDAVAGPLVGALTTSWAAPGSDGGCALTKYRLHSGATSGSEALLVELSPSITSYQNGGLGNGVTRFYRAQAVNCVGTSAFSNEDSATTWTLPTAPQAFDAAAGPDPGKITLAWNAPASTGGTSITNYKIYRGTAPGGETFLTQVGNVLSHVDASLPNGVTRYYKVSAVNAVGEGPQSTADSATTWSAPSEPLNFQAVAGPGAGQVSLSWDPPGSLNGCALSSYTVYESTQSGAGYTFLASVLPAVETYERSSLPNGATRYYRVTGTNCVGEGSGTPERVATTFSLASAPQGLDAVSGPASGEATITWTAPASNGGTPVTGYRVYRGATPSETSLIASLGAVLSYVDAGLTGGTTYYYRVSALNLVGEGPLSTADSVVALAVPSAPQTLVAASGPGQGEVKLTWVAPASTGGSAITEYRVLRGSSSGGESLYDDVPGAVLTYTDAGNPAGTTYYYKVAAANGVGEGPKSNEASGATFTEEPASLPSGRGDTAAIWSGTKAYVFGGIGDSGAAAPEGASGPETAEASSTTYLDDIVEYDPVTNTMTILDVPLPTQRCCVAAAWTGTDAYLFGGQDDAGYLRQVLKFNPATGTLTNLGDLMPTGRCCLAASYADGYVWLFGGQGSSGETGQVLRFDPVTNSMSNLGDLMPTNRCCLTASSDGDDVWIFGGRCCLSSEASDSQEILKFDPDTTSFTNLGNLLPTGRCCMASSWSGTEFLLFGGRSGDAELSDALSFDSATNVVTSLGDVLPTQRCCVSAVWTGTDALVFGGEESDGGHTDDVVRFRPSAPTSPAAAPGPGAGQVTLTWNTPTLGGSSIAGYKVYRGTASDGESLLTTLGGSTLNYVDSGIGNGATRYYKVSATSANGESPQSAEVSATTFDVPSSPLSPAAAAGPGAGQIRVTWNAPAGNGGTPITGVQVWARSGSCAGLMSLAATVGPSATSFVHSGLGNAAFRCYEVRAVNLVGAGAPSSPRVSATTFTVPGAPQNLQANAGVEQTVLTWQAGTNGGTPITAYLVYRATLTTGETPYAFTGPATSFTDTNCPVGTVCTYRVSAFNLVGEGPKSNAASAPGTVLPV